MAPKAGTPRHQCRGRGYHVWQKVAEGPGKMLGAHGSRKGPLPLDPWKRLMTFRCQHCFVEKTFSYRDTSRKYSLRLPEVRGAIRSKAEFLALQRQLRKAAVDEKFRTKPLWQCLPNWNGSELTWLACLAKLPVTPALKATLRNAFLKSVVRSGGGALLPNIKTHDVVVCTHMADPMQVFLIPDPSVDLIGARYAYRCDGSRRTLTRTSL